MIQQHLNHLRIVKDNVRHTANSTGVFAVDLRYRGHHRRSPMTRTILLALTLVLPHASAAALTGPAESGISLTCSMRVCPPSAP
jgi:hypothetical protein